MIPLTLKVLEQTATTVTLGWTPVPCAGYVLYADGIRMSNTWDPNKSSWKTSKAKEIKIVAIDIVAEGVYTESSTPPPTANKLKIDAAGRLSWTALPGVSEYEIAMISPAGVTTYVKLKNNVLTYAPAAHPGEKWQYDLNDGVVWSGRVEHTWPGSPLPPPVDPPPAPAGSKRLGTMLSSDQCTPATAAWMKSQGISSVTARWEMKPDPWTKDRGPADKIADFCRANGFSLRIHCVAWHQESTIFGAVTDKPTKKKQLQDFAKALVTAYGDIKDVRIDVANECFVENGVVRDTPIVRSYGGVTIAALYEVVNDIVAAVKSVKNIPCVYNEYGYVEWTDTGKANACVALVKGTNVDGFGCQYHPNTDAGQPTQATITAAVKRITDLGKQFEFTEVGIPNASATRFANLFAGGKDANRITFWGGWDGNSDVSGGPGAPSQPWTNTLTPKADIVSKAHAWAGVTAPPVDPPPVDPPPVDPPPVSTGFKFGLVCRVDTADIAHAKNLGAKVVRVEWNYNRVGSDLDELVNGHAANGVKVQPLAGFNSGLPSSAGKIREWALRHGPQGTGRITHIEWGNETSYQYQHGGACQEWAHTYATCAKLAAESLVGTGVGLLVQADDASGWKWTKFLAEQVPDLGKHPSVVGIVLHPYGPGGHEKLANTINDWKANGWPDLPIYCTEWGIATNNGGTMNPDNYGFTRALSYQQAADLLKSEMAFYRANKRVTELLYYMSVDGNASSNDREACFGLLTSNGGDKGPLTVEARKQAAF